MNIHVNQFKDLTVFQLYEILKLRNQVFIVEQCCAYPDVDGKDINSLHIYGEVDGKVVACLRIVPGEIPAIGRVAVSEDHRKKGYARALMKQALKTVKKEYQKEKIQLQAQYYLLEFYKDLGFMPISQKYLEDNIPHIDMIYTQSCI